MPLLASLVVTLFGGFASYLTAFLTVRAATIAAALATFATLNVALYATATALTATLTTAFPSVLMTGVWLMSPDNLVPCFSIIIGCDTACALYRWNSGALKLAAGVA